MDAELDDRLGHLLGALEARLPASHGQAALLHGGFRLGQVIVDSAGSLTLLDLDGVCRGESAQDLATALGHLCWQAIRQPTYRTTLQLAEQAFLAGHQRRAGAVDPVGLSWWRAAALLQVAARRFRRLEVWDWRSVPLLLDLAEDLLHTGQLSGCR